LLPRSIAIEARRKVLLVDDDAVSLELMALMLAHEGYQVLQANNAGAALAMLSEENPAGPDVLLVDLQMPGVSGGQLAEKVRAMRTPESRPLLLAMSATEVQRQQVLAFDGFLLKPLALSDLRQALDPDKRGHKPRMRVLHPIAAKQRQDNSEVLDKAVVQKLLTMMPFESFKNVVDACLADARACIATLQSRSIPENGKLVSEMAHRIKGAAGMVGATRMAGLAARLEVGGYKEAATHAVLNELLCACIEVEGMLLAGKFKKIRAPHHEPTDRNHAARS
jgi:two-component system aerobic respiration control sensor histidine kinase ArcB